MPVAYTYGPLCVRHVALQNLIFTYHPPGRLVYAAEKVIFDWESAYAAVK